MTMIVTIIAITANSASLTSTSCTAWAFARDSGVPFSGHFALVDGKVNIPKRMVVLVTIMQMLLGFLCLANYTAFNAALSMAILGMYTSYILPIIYMALYGRKDSKLVFGPFKLGKIFGLFVNIVAIAWLVIAVVFSTFPNFEPVTPDNMNYSVVVISVWVLFGARYFVSFGVKVT
jgi:choline transport protein